MKKIQLVRFFASEDRAKQFLSGKIFMNYLGYFWGPDLDKLAEEKEREHWDKKKITPAKYGQDDFFEGAVVLQNKEHSFVPEEMRDMCVGNVILRVESYRYCNLLCM